MRVATTDGYEDVPSEPKAETQALQSAAPRRTPWNVDDELWRWLQMKAATRDTDVCELLERWREAGTDAEGDEILRGLEEMRIAALEDEDEDDEDHEDDEA